MGSSLVALGGALVATGVLGRLGRRIGLPTIPLFMLAVAAPLLVANASGVRRGRLAA